MVEAEEVLVVDVGAVVEEVAESALPPMKLTPPPAVLPRPALEISLPALPLPLLAPSPLSATPLRLLLAAAGITVVLSALSLFALPVSLEAEALPEAKEPPEERDSAARESEAIVPGFSVWVVVGFGAFVGMGTGQ